MSDEREVNNPDGTVGKLVFSDLSDDQLEQHLATVLHRGQTHIRLNVPLPADLYGEWVPNSPDAIFEKENLGFRIDTQYATSNALHNDGTGKAILGDTIFMVCARRNKEIIDKLNAKIYEQNHGAKRKEKDVKEEREYKGSRHEAVEVDEKTTKISSSLNVIDAQSIEAARRAAIETQKLSVDTTQLGEK